MPPIPGAELKGVISFRDIQDVNRMLDYCKTKQNAVVIGGGLLGLEAAYGLKQQGMNVTVLHLMRPYYGSSTGYESQSNAEKIN